MSKPKTTTRKPRRKAMNVNAVIEMAEFRHHMRSMARQRQAFAKANAPWRRIAAKLVTLVIVGGISAVLVSHHLAYTAAPVMVAHIGP
jgi:hypothetical protein